MYKVNFVCRNYLLKIMQDTVNQYIIQDLLGFDINDLLLMTRHYKVNTITKIHVHINASYTFDFQIEIIEMFPHH